MKRAPTIDQLRARLERAKRRGRVDEIRAAAGALGGAASKARAEQRAEQRARVERAGKKTAEALDAVTKARAELAALPVVAPSVDPGAAGRRGAAVRKLRAAEQRALRAVVEQQRAGPPKAAPQLSPEDAQRQRRAIDLMAAFAKLLPGNFAFRELYVITEPGEGAYHYGVSVSWTPDGVSYRWTGRALERKNAAMDLRALKRSYDGGQQPPPMVDQRRKQPEFGSYDQARQLASAGRDFDLLVSMDRA